MDREFPMSTTAPTPPIKSYYENYWSTGKQVYSGSNQGYAANFRRWMAEELRDLPAGAPILEVGCGDGAFTTELAKYSSFVTALDLSASQIEENRRRFPGIAFAQHDVAEPLPFPDAAFDVAWCSEVLEHLFDPAFALREMHRVLRPGGRLLVTVPYHGGLKNVLDVASRPYGDSAWSGKPAAVVSVSPGAIGAFGANHHLRQSLVFLDMPTLQQPEAYVGHAAELFDENGKLKNEGTEKFLRAFMQKFADWVETHA